MENTENNANVDVLILKSIEEKLQKIEDLYTKKGDSNIQGTIKNIESLFHNINEKLESNSNYLLSLPKHNYTGSIDSLREKFNQFKIELDSSLKNNILTQKQKRIVIITIGSLVLLLSISIFINFRMSDRLNPAIENDMKYRYMQSLGDNAMIGATAATDSIFDKYTFSSIKKSVEDREELVRKKISADIRARYAEQEAFKLRVEAEKLKKQAE